MCDGLYRPSCTRKQALGSFLHIYIQTPAWDSESIYFVGLFNDSTNTTI